MGLVGNRLAEVASDRSRDPPNCCAPSALSPFDEATSTCAQHAPHNRSEPSALPSSHSFATFKPRSLRSVAAGVAAQCSAVA